jgi:hypothetical protein
MTIEIEKLRKIPYFSTLNPDELAREKLRIMALE